MSLLLPFAVLLWGLQGTHVSERFAGGGDGYISPHGYASQEPEIADYGIGPPYIPPQEPSIPYIPPEIPFVQAPAQAVIAAQLLVSPMQAVETYLAAIPALTTGQSIGIAVPAGTPEAAALLGVPYVPPSTFIRISNDVTGEIRSVPLDYYNANANTIYSLWTPV